MDNGIKILLVEDNEVNQHLIRRILQSRGLGAELASNGREALQKVIQTRYDLILMDIQMPEMDGLTATRLIRQQLPAGQQPKIIAITAIYEKDQYLAAGMDDYLTKPIQVDELIALIDRYNQSIPASRASQPPAESPSPAANAQSAESARLPGAIDTRVLIDFQQMMGPDGARDVEHLVALYLKNAVALWNEMVKTVKGAEYDGLARAAHTLKGNSYQVGANQLADYCKALEASAHTANREAILGHLKIIKDELLQVLSELRNYRPR